MTFGGRPIFLNIENDNTRIGTDNCIQLIQRLVGANLRLKLDQKRISVELIVGSSIGHDAIEVAYMLEAKFVLKQVSDQESQR